MNILQFHKYVIMNNNKNIVFLIHALMILHRFKDTCKFQNYVAIAFSGRITEQRQH